MNMEQLSNYSQANSLEMRFPGIRNMPLPNALRLVGEITGSPCIDEYVHTTLEYPPEKPGERPSNNMVDVRTYTKVSPRKRSASVGYALRSRPQVQSEKYYHPRSTSENRYIPEPSVRTLHMQDAARRKKSSKRFSGGYEDQKGGALSSPIPDHLSPRDIIKDLKKRALYETRRWETSYQEMHTNSPQPQRTTNSSYSAGQQMRSQQGDNIQRHAGGYERSSCRNRENYTPMPHTNQGNQAQYMPAQNASREQLIDMNKFNECMQKCRQMSERVVDIQQRRVLVPGSFEQPAQHNCRPRERRKHRSRSARDDTTSDYTTTETEESQFSTIPCPKTLTKQQCALLKKKWLETVYSIAFGDKQSDKDGEINEQGHPIQSSEETSFYIETSRPPVLADALNRNMMTNMMPLPRSGQHGSVNWSNLDPTTCLPPDQHQHEANQQIPGIKCTRYEQFENVPASYGSAQQGLEMQNHTTPQPFGKKPSESALTSRDVAIQRSQQLVNQSFNQLSNEREATINLSPCAAARLQKLQQMDQSLSRLTNEREGPANLSPCAAIRLQQQQQQMDKSLSQITNERDASTNPFPCDAYRIQQQQPMDQSLSRLTNEREGPANLSPCAAIRLQQQQQMDQSLSRLTNEREGPTNQSPCAAIRMQQQQQMDQSLSRLPNEGEAPTNLSPCAAIRLQQQQMDQSLSRLTNERERPANLSPCAAIRLQQQQQQMDQSLSRLTNEREAPTNQSPCAAIRMQQTQQMDLSLSRLPNEREAPTNLSPCAASRIQQQQPMDQSLSQLPNEREAPTNSSLYAAEPQQQQQQQKGQSYNQVSNERETPTNLSPCAASRIREQQQMSFNRLPNEEGAPVALSTFRSAPVSKSLCPYAAEPQQQPQMGQSYNQVSNERETPTNLSPCAASRIRQQQQMEQSYNQLPNEMGGLLASSALGMDPASTNLSPCAAAGMQQYQQMIQNQLNNPSSCGKIARLSMNDQNISQHSTGGPTPLALPSCGKIARLNMNDQNISQHSTGGPTPLALPTTEKALVLANEPSWDVARQQNLMPLDDDLEQYPSAKPALLALPTTENALVPSRDISRQQSKHLVNSDQAWDLQSSRANNMSRSKLGTSSSRCRCLEQAQPQQQVQQAPLMVIYNIHNFALRDNINTRQDRNYKLSQTCITKENETDNTRTFDNKLVFNTQNKCESNPDMEKEILEKFIESNIPNSINTVLCTFDTLRDRIKKNIDDITTTLVATDATEGTNVSKLHMLPGEPQDTKIVIMSPAAAVDDKKALEWFDTNSTNQGTNVRQICQVPDTNEKPSLHDIQQTIQGTAKPICPDINLLNEIKKSLNSENLAQNINDEQINLILGHCNIHLLRNKTNSTSNNKICAVESEAKDFAHYNLFDNEYAADTTEYINKLKECSKFIPKSTQDIDNSTNEEVDAKQSVNSNPMVQETNVESNVEKIEEKPTADETLYTATIGAHSIGPTVSSSPIIQGTDVNSNEIVSTAIIEKPNENNTKVSEENYNNNVHGPNVIIIEKPTTTIDLRIICNQNPTVSIDGVDIKTGISSKPKADANDTTPITQGDDQINENVDETKISVESPILVDLIMTPLQGDEIAAEKPTADGIDVEPTVNTTDIKPTVDDEPAVNDSPTNDDKSIVDDKPTIDASDDMPAVDDEPTANDSSTNDDKPIADDKPTIDASDDIPAVDDEPTANDNSTNDDKPIVDDMPAVDEAEVKPTVEASANMPTDGDMPPVNTTDEKLTADEAEDKHIDDIFEDCPTDIVDIVEECPTDDVADDKPIAVESDVKAANDGSDDKPTVDRNDDKPLLISLEDASNVIAIADTKTEDDMETLQDNVIKALKSSSNNKIEQPTVTDVSSKTNQGINQNVVDEIKKVLNSHDPAHNVNDEQINLILQYCNIVKDNTDSAPDNKANVASTNSEDECKN